MQFASLFVTRAYLCSSVAYISRARLYGGDYPLAGKINRENLEKSFGKPYF